MPCINEDLDAFLLYVLDKLILLAISCNDLLLLWNYLMLEAAFDAEGGKPEYEYLTHSRRCPKINNTLYVENHFFSRTKNLEQNGASVL